MRERLPIGFFDSGVGGLSVLRLALRELPDECFIYYGDNKNAPYGMRTSEQIVELTERASELLLEKGIKALVIACNTATAAAIDTLRAHVRIPVIGMEPAIKPAVRLRSAGSVLVLATPATLALPRFAALNEHYGGDCVQTHALGELVGMVEREATDAEIADYLKDRFPPSIVRQAEVVVLGCTHFVFARAAIVRHFGGAAVIDGNAGTVAQLKRVLMREGLLAAGPAPEPRARLITSGTQETLLIMERLLKA